MVLSGHRDELCVMNVTLSHLLPTLLLHHVGAEWEVLQLGGFRTPTLGHRSALATPNHIHASIASSSTVWERQRGGRDRKGGKSEILAPVCPSLQKKKKQNFSAQSHNLKLSISSNYTQLGCLAPSAVPFKCRLALIALPNPWHFVKMQLNANLGKKKNKLGKGKRKKKIHTRDDEICCQHACREFCIQH